MLTDCVSTCRTIIAPGFKDVPEDQFSLGNGVIALSAFPSKRAKMRSALVHRISSSKRFDPKVTVATLLVRAIWSFLYAL